jgi:hypothetical protein
MAAGGESRNAALAEPKAALEANLLGRFLLRDAIRALPTGVLRGFDRQPAQLKLPRAIGRELVGGLGVGAGIEEVAKPVRVQTLASLKLE